MTTSTQPEADKGTTSAGVDRGTPLPVSVSRWSGVSATSSDARLYRIVPADTRSSSVRRVSSIGARRSHPCSQYRST